MNSFFENKYFNTYYYANIVNNILYRDIELIGFISKFFTDEVAVLYLTKPFDKKNAFHSFIEHIIGDIFENDMDEYDQRCFEHSLYADFVLKEYGMSDNSFHDFVSDKNKISYEEVENYLDELRLTGILEELYKRIGDEVFYLLFNNRDALMRFNHIVAGYILKVGLNDIEVDEIMKRFNKKGVLKRERIPEWAKRAVFFRDRGRCCFCLKDVSGLLHSQSIKQFDHIVPLSHGGLNDVCNLQLLCSNCNAEKGNKHITTSNLYQSWY